MRAASDRRTVARPCPAAEASAGGRGVRGASWFIVHAEPAGRAVEKVREDREPIGSGCLLSAQSEPVEKRSSHGLAHFVDHDVVDRQIDGNDTGAELVGIQPEDAQSRILAYMGWLLDEVRARYPSWAEDELQRTMTRLVQVQAAAECACPKLH